ncbi:MAG: hypothetical protein R3D66_01930 [Alphaproteobacteria bacterium]
MSELAKKGLSQEQINEELGKAGITYMAEFNFQLYEMGKATYDLYNAEPEQQQALLYMMQVYEKKAWTWGTFGRALWKSVVDPVNLALMVGSAGTGFLAAKGIQAGVMKGLQTALTFGASRVAEKTVVETAKAGIKETTWMAFKRHATSRFALGMSATGAAGGATFGGLDAHHRQHVQIAADFQKDYSVANTAEGSAAGALVGGLLAFAFPVGAGTGKVAATNLTASIRETASGIGDTLARVKYNFEQLAPEFPQPAMGTPGATSSMFGGGSDAWKGLVNDVKRLAKSIRKTKQEAKQATKSSYTDQIKQDRQNESLGWKKNKDQWRADTTEESKLLTKGAKTYKLQSDRLNDPAKAERLSPDHLRQSLSNLESEIQTRIDLKQKLADELKDLKAKQANLERTDGDSGATVGRIITQKKTLETARAEHQANIDAKLAEDHHGFIATKQGMEAEELHLRGLLEYQERLNERMQAVTDHLHKLNEIETQQTTLKGKLDTAAEAAKKRAEEAAEKAAMALPPPPEPSKTPAKEHTGMPSIKLPDMASEKDWIRIFAYMRVVFTRSIKQLFSPKSDVNRSNKITRPVIDAVDKHLQDLGLVSKFVEKDSKREPYFQAEQPITWLPLHLPKIIKQGSVEKGLIRELQDKVIAIAKKDGWTDAEVQKAFKDFAIKNGTKLEHARANIRKLRAKVASDAYKPTKKFLGHGLNETHRQKLLNHLDHWDNTLDDLSKVSGGQNADEAIRTLRAIERKELRFYGNAKEPQDIRTLTLDTVDDTVYGLFRASFDENRSYIQHEGLWPKEVIEKRKNDKAPGMDSIHASAQYRQLLEFEIQEGLYNDQELSPKTIRASYLSLATENFERLIQNSIIEFYTKRDEKGALVNVPGNKWESTTISEYAGRLIQAQKKGWGSEALFAIEYLKRAKQLFGQGDLNTIPPQDMIEQYLKSLPQYKEDPGFRIWAETVINAHDDSSLPGRPNLLGWMLKENRFGWSAAASNVYGFDLGRRYRGTNYFSLPGSVTIQSTFWGKMLEFGAWFSGFKEIKFADMAPVGHKKVNFNPEQMSFVWKSDDETYIAPFRRMFLRWTMPGLVNDITSIKPWNLSDKTWQLNWKASPALLLLGGIGAAEAGWNEMVYHLSPDPEEGEEKERPDYYTGKVVNTYLNLVDGVYHNAILGLASAPAITLDFFGVIDYSKIEGISDWIRTPKYLAKKLDTFDILQDVSFIDSAQKEAKKAAEGRLKPQPLKNLRRRIRAARLKALKPMTPNRKTPKPRRPNPEKLNLKLLPELRSSSKKTVWPIKR